MKVDDIGALIAERELLLSKRDGEETIVRVKLGMPLPFPDETGYYAPFQVTGVGSERVKYAGGVDAIQAIQLAMKMVGAYLGALTHEGGDLSWQGDDKGDLGFPIMFSQAEFDQALQRITSAWSKGDLTSAYSEIEMVLREGSADMKGQCLLFRGVIKEDQGELEGAKQDWLNALAYPRPGTYLRYNLESNIGKVCETLGLHEEAIRWYWTALNTCFQGDEFSGHRALAALLTLNGGQVPLGDNLLFASVSKKSWQVLQLPGTPDLNDLAGTVSKLAGGFQNLVEKVKQESSDSSAN